MKKLRTFFYYVILLSMFWGLLVCIKKTVEKNLDKLPYTIMPENTFKHVLKTAIDQNNHDRIVAMLDGSHKHNLSEANLHDIFKTAVMHQNSSLAQKVIQHQNFNSNYQDEQGNTALIIALLHKQPNIAQEIIAIPNTNINLKNFYHQTALHHAILNNNINIAKQMLPMLNSEADFSEFTRIAIQTNNLELVKLFSDKIEKNDTSIYLIEQAARTNNIGIVKELLNHNLYNTNSLNHAFHAAGRLGYTDIAKLLLKHGATTNIYNSSAYNLIDSVTSLLQQGADPNFPSKREQYIEDTPLITAAQHGHTKIVKLLLNAKADPNLKRDAFSAHNLDPFNENVGRHKLINVDYTALMLAAKNNHPDIVKLLLDAKAEPNAQNHYKNTALILAAIEGHPEIIKLLLNAGADPNIKNHENVTALLEAAARGHTEIVKQLLKHRKVNINVQNNHGVSSLMHAAWHGHTEIAKLLIDAGANKNLKNSSGNTALDSAKHKKHQNIVNLLA